MRHRIVCDELVCFEFALTLGEGSAVALVRRSQRTREAAMALLPLQPKLFSDLDLAELRAENVDLVVARSDAGAADRYRGAGLPVMTWEAIRTPNYDALSFVDAHMQRMRTFAKLLGPEAEARASKWAEYVDAKLSFVWSRTRYRGQDMRPRAAYLDHELGGPDDGVTPYVSTSAFLGGATVKLPYVSNTVAARALSKEELIAWNPELLFLGRSASRAPFSEDPQLRTLHAVTHNAVYTLPETAFPWHDGPESVLLTLWIAKLAQPALFRDLNVPDEVRSYYDQFYGLRLSDEQLERMFD